ncbi:MAG TPA: zinc-binding alcohol dehydrogenase [Acidimicrobiia bacterium]|jgi:2-desacetyl-2-hydroxyethyl bacteriochlorophyllide A dehydrogenase|nr:zinc-binding alcohol dehydrogenase [Acidimicrobiia bacterium]
MRAERLVFTARGRCEVDAFEVPDARLGAGEVVVRSVVSLLSPGTELAIFTHNHRGFDVPDHWARYPWFPGYATVGVVVDAGERSPLPTGTLVFHRMPHASLYRLPADWLIPIPASLAPDRAVFFMLVQVAMTAMRRAPVRFGEQVVVLGQGMVGNLAAQLAREAGARSVAGADLVASRLAIAQRCGVERQWNLADRPLESWLEELGSPGASYVVEAVGAGPSVDAALKATASGGRCVLLGSTQVTLEFDPYFDVHKKGLDVVGAHEDTVDAETRRRDRPFILDLLGRERVRVDPLLTHRLPFADAPRAYEGLRDDKEHWLGVLLEHG